MLFHEKFYPILICIWQFDSSRMFDTSICSRLFPHYATKRIPTTPCCQLIPNKLKGSALPGSPWRRGWHVFLFRAASSIAMGAPHHELSTYFIYFIIFQLEEIPFSLDMPCSLWLMDWCTQIYVDVSWISQQMSRTCLTLAMTWIAKVASGLDRSRFGEVWVRLQSFLEKISPVVVSAHEEAGHGMKAGRPSSYVTNPCQSYTMLSCNLEDDDSELSYHIAII